VVLAIEPLSIELDEALTHYRVRSIDKSRNREDRER
jgi:hypothetical protein